MKNVKIRIVVLVILSTLTINNIFVRCSVVINSGNNNKVEINERSPEE